METKVANLFEENIDKNTIMEAGKVIKRWRNCSFSYRNCVWIRSKCIDVDAVKKNIYC